MCGEQISRRRRSCIGTGSSPRVRGTVPRQPELATPLRFIPACAGNRGGFHARVGDVTVHPRVCGEQETFGTDPSVEAGSSPRVRGTASRGIISRRLLRFIPACAGNSVGVSHPYRSAAVHPRVCGEQRIGPLSAHNDTGSSPRVRGTVAGFQALVDTVRFIPACAGNSPGACSGRWSGPVHPRVCGEQMQLIMKAGSNDGSSPRVRGTGNQEGGKNHIRRFIPACAGNRPSSLPANGSGSVHPRVCGEQRNPCLPAIPHNGSSPRVRGTVHTLPCKIPGHRFIPACAGNSQQSRDHGQVGPVHPRVCGEQDYYSTLQPPQTGSSPRVRGTAGGRTYRRESRRFIPACAGNSIPLPKIVLRSTVHPRVCGEQGV